MSVARILNGNNLETARTSCLPLKMLLEIFIYLGDWFISFPWFARFSHIENISLFQNTMIIPFGVSLYNVVPGAKPTFPSTGGDKIKRSLPQYL
jgi:hypothetical protein